MNQHTSTRFSLLAVSTVCCAAMAWAVAMPINAWAQVSASTDAKSVVVEATQTPVSSPAANPFVAFGQWLQQVVTPLPAPQITVPVVVQPFVVAPAPVGNFEAPAVILGQPELPLLGQAAAQAAQQWNTGLNYQGLTLSYVVVDQAGRQREIRPINKGLAPGERFKLRYTTTFDAVAAIDQIVGETWSAQSFGQVWPQPGTSVASRAGETVELPLEPGAFFQLDGNPNVRYVLTVRHPQAKGSARSSQPAYRQDGARASQYLQLVPATTYPVIGQVISARAPR
jgi:hypothetical protein